MNIQKYAIASAATAAFFFLYGFVVYAVLFPDYIASIVPDAMAMPEGDQGILYIALGCLVQGFVLTYIFIRGLENKGLMEGLRFGLLVGIFIFGTYLVLVGTSPFSLRAIITFGIFDLVMYMGGGTVMALLYKP